VTTVSESLLTIDAAQGGGGGQILRMKEVNTLIQKSLLENIWLISLWQPVCNPLVD